MITICGSFLKSSPSIPFLIDSSTFSLYPVKFLTFTSANFLYRSPISITAQFNALDACFGSVTTGISKCGIPWYALNSTTFGSIMISFTSSGVALYKILMINVLIQTDLPEPVAPAIKRCGILEISDTITCPARFFPTANAIFDLACANSWFSISSLNITIWFVLFGTSIPIADLPGIGASIRISAAARFNLISSARFTILLTFTPCSGCNSNCVTDGPQLILVIVTWTPKSSNVFCSFCAVWRSSSLLFPAVFFPFSNKDTGGNL